MAIFMHATAIVGAGAVAQANSTISIDNACRYVGLLTNIFTILGFGFGLGGAYWAGRRFIRERAFDRMQMLYHLANELWRKGLSVQKDRKNGKWIKTDPICKTRDTLKNWFHDNRFLFERKGDRRIGELVDGVSEEAKSFISTGCMDKLDELRTELEGRMRKLF